MFRPSTTAFSFLSTDPQYQGNIEIVRRSGNSLQHLWSSGISANWTLEQTFGSNIRSNPALCSNLDDNLLQVVVREYGYLVHYYRTSDQEWIRQGDINTPLMNYYYIYDPAMICNTATHKLEVAAVETYSANCVHYYIRNGDYWGSPQRLYPQNSGLIKNAPALIQDAAGRCWLAAYVETSSGAVVLEIWSKTATGNWSVCQYAEQIVGTFDWSVAPTAVTYNEGTTSYVSFLVKMTGNENKLMVEISGYNPSITFNYNNWTMPYPIANLSGCSTNDLQIPVLLYSGANPGRLYEVSPTVD